MRVSSWWGVDVVQDRTGDRRFLTTDAVGASVAHVPVYLAVARLPLGSAGGCGKQQLP